MMSSARPVSKQVTHERIICAAINVFSDCGYEGASLRTIARQAQVNEVTLFRYFPRKLDLFVAAIEAAACQVRFPAGLKQKLVQGEHPSAILALVFEFLVDMAVRHPEVLRLLSFAALESQLSAMVLRSSLRPAFVSLSEYLGSCMDEGKIRRLEPDVLAEALVLAAVTQLACAHTIGQNVGDRWQLPAMCNALWLDGILVP